MGRKRTPTVEYLPSPEHKQHKGSWGSPQWHLRKPALSPCPKDVSLEQARRWLESALQHECWKEAPEPGEAPRYLYWYDADTDRLFQARCTREEVGRWVYKGYPMRAGELTRRMRAHLLARELIDEERATILRRRAQREKKRRGGR